MPNRIPKSPYPLFAYRFACDYANDGDSIIAIGKICRGKVDDLIHPGDYSLYTSDENVLERLSSDILIRRKKKEVFAIEDPEILQKLLGIEECEYFYDEEGWIKYDVLGMKYHTIEADIEIFQESGIQLVCGKEEELLRLMSSK